MLVKNVHERTYPVEASQVGALIDALASDRDQLWPRDAWPAMRFDRPLAVGASGGHGPVRYDVCAYEPGRSIHFRFRAPRGFVGTHRLELEPLAGSTRLRHVIEMDAVGPALASWPLVFRPLHDALLEDALDRAERALTGTIARPARWSPRVRALRWLLARMPDRRRSRSPDRGR